MKLSPEEQTMPYYDIAYADWTDQMRTEGELDLIKSLLPAKASILDIGSGSGRTMVPLLEAGYTVTGIDYSRFMVTRLRSKVPEANIIYGNFQHYNFTEKYSLVMCMWNTFTQLAFSQAEAQDILEKIQKILGPGGIVVINMTAYNDATNPQYITFTDEKVTDDAKYTIRWTLDEFDKKSGVMTRTERITKSDLEGAELNDARATIKQKWWHPEDFVSLLKQIFSNGKVSVETIKDSTDLYYIVQT